ncbi:MAG: ATP-binding protein [Halohasta sp.]
MQQPSNQLSSCFRHLFEELEDAVVKFELVDGEPMVREANDAFREVFGYDAGPVVGEPLNDLIVPATKHEEAKQFDERTRAGESNAAIVERMTDDGERKFVYRGVPYRDGYGFAIYSDITDELQRERHLDVLHRVLRHNLRNDLTVILGMATKIIEEADDPAIESTAAKIKRTAGDLSQLSDEAKTIEKALGETTDLQPIDLQPLAEEVATSCAARFETAAITTDVPTGLRVRANDKLRIVLRSLVDNAIRHNDAAEPRATVSASTGDDGTVRLAVRDNGPGIPVAEQRIIVDDAEITPLNHGSGLGLWLVKWIVDSYGGTVGIDTLADGGTVVELQLNRAVD